MNFKPDFKPNAHGNDNDFLFIMNKGKIVLKKENNIYLIPRFSDFPKNTRALNNDSYFGEISGCSCYIAECEDESKLSDSFELKQIGELFVLLPDDMVLTSGLAAQLYRWNNSHKFCGQCGGLTEDKADERAKVCLKCDLIYFPRLSPAVIVAVIKDKKILLARSGRFPYGFYSVLAGFVQPGETLEECVAREVYEEVGIVVKNIRYFDSQPWPFPDSLMLGFTAEYASGDIYVDQSEIADAGWFGAFNMPNIPPKISIARQLIDWYVDNFK